MKRFHQLSLIALLLSCKANSMQRITQWTDAECFLKNIVVYTFAPNCISKKKIKPSIKFGHIIGTLPPSISEFYKFSSKDLYNCMIDKRLIPNEGWGYALQALHKKNTQDNCYLTDHFIKKHTINMRLVTKEEATALLKAINENNKTEFNDYFGVTFALERLTGKE